MSARGARSRKAVVKDIEKQEKKNTEKSKAAVVDSVRQPQEAFPGWRPTPSVNIRDTGHSSRQLTISTPASRGTSRPSSTGSVARPALGSFSSPDIDEYRPEHRPRASTTGTASISDSSTTSKEKTKYQTKGKETKAPRGRGGGVPVKSSTPVVAAPPLFRAEPTVLPQSPTNAKTWMNFRIWESGEKGLRPYGGFDYVGVIEILVDHS
jgi:hypothetical protein